MTAMPLHDLEPDGGPHVPDEVAEFIAAASGSAAAQLLTHLQRGGADPAESLRLLGPLMIVQAKGPLALEEYGLPARSSERIRGRIADLLAAAGAPVPPPGTPGAVRQRGRRSAR